MKPLAIVAFVSAVLALPGPARAADAVKLKPLSVAYMDEKGEGLNGPEGIAWDGRSTLAVADAGSGRIVLFGFDGERFIPGGALAVPQLPYPIRVQVDSKGSFLVLDGKVRRIGRLSAKGEFQGYLAYEGVSSRQSVLPRSFKLDREDNLYILDVHSARVLVLGPDGALRREIPFPDKSGFFPDLSVDAGGDIFLVDCIGKRVYSAPRGSTAFTALGGTLKEDADFPVGVAPDTSGTLYVLDENGGGVVILGRDGSFQGRQLGMGWQSGLLRYPTQLAVTDKGIIFIADRGNNRVQAYAIVR